MANEDSEIKTLRLRIEGFVQAVGYRNYAIAEANRLKLDGWIRNRADGTVEALVSGPVKDVEAFVTAAMRGPAGSTVKNVMMKTDPPPEEKGFHRRPSI